MQTIDQRWTSNCSPLLVPIETWAKVIIAIMIVIVMMNTLRVLLLVVKQYLILLLAIHLTILEVKTMVPIVMKITTRKALEIVKITHCC